MKVLENASLRSLNSLAVDASAKLLISIDSEEDLLSLPAFDSKKDFVLGGGSNVLFATSVPGTVFLNRIAGREIVEEHDDRVLIEVGSGENWHELVQWTLATGLCGLENLSLIPGLAGAAPVQNIGAYGVELSSALESVTAWDWRKSGWVMFSKDECKLEYRDSRFKSAESGPYLITSLRLRLNRHGTPHIEYAGLRDELEAMGISQADSRQVSDAVIRIRQRKLPDPAQIGNAGSFFKNPIVNPDEAAELQQLFPALPGWPAGAAKVKLSAAWMIEFCGLKGFRNGDAGVSDQHSLVLVNHGSASGSEIANLARQVSTLVFEQFGVHLQQEPVLVDFGK
jgi:UDP-N-acetylmuramate dehydrogenase